MLVTFTSPAFYDITMFGDVAEQLIRMMGHSGTIPSAIGADDIPAALEHLKSAVKAQENRPKTDQRTDADEDEEDEPVSLSNRAFPLMEMLKAAAAQDSNIMWFEKK